MEVLQLQAELIASLGYHLDAAQLLTAGGQVVPGTEGLLRRSGILFKNIAQHLSAAAAPPP